MSRDARFFRGNELPLLLFLGGLSVVGGLGYWVYVQGKEDSPRREPRLARTEPLPPPDSRIELAGVVDKHPLTSRENPAQLLLLEQTRTTPPAELARAARRDVLYGQVMRNAPRYRGLPIHIEGHALRVTEEWVEGSALYPSGHFYEAWIGSEDSRPYFWHVIFENAPADLALGDDVGRMMRFDGYFLKLLAYEAHDKKFYFEPLLIGRLAWVEPGLATEASGASWMTNGWLVGVLVVIIVMGLARWYFYARRAFGRRRARLVHSRLPVRDQIDPDALSAWLNRDDDDEESDD